MSPVVFVVVAVGSRTEERAGLSVEGVARQSFKGHRFLRCLLRRRKHFLLRLICFIFMLVMRSKSKVHTDPEATKFVRFPTISGFVS